MSLINFNLSSWADWGNVFCSIPHFEKLIRKVYEREGHTSNTIRGLTPGTNAVFQVDNSVIKLFAPIQSTLDTSQDYLYELTCMQESKKLGINSPRVLAHGEIQDKYNFRYIIMEFIRAMELESLLPNLSMKQKIILAQQLKQLTGVLSGIKTCGVPFSRAHNDAYTNSRWDDYTDGFKSEKNKILDGIVDDNIVFTHGDLTAQNVLVSDDGKVWIIDFADCHIAPKYYDYPPIAFDAFNFDPVAGSEFFKGFSKAELKDALLRGILLHDFGGYIAKVLTQKYDAGDVTTCTDLSVLKFAISSYVESLDF